jgi:UDPglucose--hexose-1-phosphate uridylyltransferase
VAEFLPNYTHVDADNIQEILEQEVGKVFVHVLEDAGVYKCTKEGREAFARFLEAL